jgi:hypothetical protein
MILDCLRHFRQAAVSLSLSRGSRSRFRTRTSTCSRNGALRFPSGRRHREYLQFATTAGAHAFTVDASRFGCPGLRGAQRRRALVRHSLGAAPEYEALLQWLRCRCKGATRTRRAAGWGSAAPGGRGHGHERGPFPCNGEAPHYLCANCFKKGQTSFIHTQKPITPKKKGAGFTCPTRRTLE